MKREPKEKSGQRRAGARFSAATIVLLVFAIVLMGGIFLLDRLANPRVAAAALYSLVIFYCWLFQGSAPVIGVAALCTALALLDVFLSAGGADHVAGINKVLSVGVIWVSAALVLFVKSSAKQLEEATERLEAESVKFETAFENAPNAMLMVDELGTIALVNRRAEVLFGYARRRLVGEKIDVLLPSPSRGALGEPREEPFVAPATGATGPNRRLTARGRDGADLRVEVGLNPIETPDGTRVIVSIVDVGEQEAAEERLRLAIEAAPTAMLMTDEQGRILLANAETEALFGYRREELTHVDLLVPDAVRRSHPELRARFVKDPKARSMGAGRELTARRKDGSEVHVEIGLNPMRSRSGTLIIASIVDISARKLAAELLEQEHQLRAERLARELLLAERIQTSILPRAPFAPGLDIAARMVPAAEVGGDYYDVFPTSEGCWIAIGDVSGHGLDAGILSLMVQSATSAVLHSIPDVEPPGVVAAVNATLYDNVNRRLERSEYVTFSVLRYARDGTVVYSGGHQDILVWRAATGVVERHPTRGIWLAVRATIDQPEMASLKLDPGDLMVLITDGLIEARNPAGDLIGMPAAVELLTSRGSEHTKQVVEALIEQSLRWSSPPEDDITVVALRHQASARV